MITILGIGIVPIIIFLNTAIGKFVERRWLPLTAIALGVLLTLLFRWDIGQIRILEGIVYGGMAMAAFDVGAKALFPKKTEANEE